MPGRLPSTEHPPEGTYVVLKNTALERIAGTDVIPLYDHGDAFRARGQFHPIFMFKYCVGVDGTVISLTQVGSRKPGVKTDVVPSEEMPPELDRHFRMAFAQWRYRPFIIDGQPTKVCTARMFKYHLN